MTEKIHLSRRKVLGSLGAIGGASAAAGLGTTAFFSDQESFGNNQLVAGSLDMKLGWESHYSDWSEDEAEHAHMEDGELVVDDQQGFLNATLQQQFPMGGGNVQAQQQINGNATPGTTWDFGDAPDQRPREPPVPHYPTKLASDGARHRDTSRAHFGTDVDEEPDARTPNRDDGDDGLISINPLTFSVTNVDWPDDLYVNALFDWAGDGSWQPFEQQTGLGPTVPNDWIVQNMEVDVDPGESKTFTGGAIPPSQLINAGWLRLTLTSEPIADYAGRGEFEIGESEDYLILPPGAGGGGGGGGGGQWFDAKCVPDSVSFPHDQQRSSTIGFQGPALKQAINNPGPCSMTVQVSCEARGFPLHLQHPPFFVISANPGIAGFPGPIICAPPPGNPRDVSPQVNVPLANWNPGQTFQVQAVPQEHDHVILGQWLVTVEFDLKCPPPAPRPFVLKGQTDCRFGIWHEDFQLRIPGINREVADIRNCAEVLETDVDRFEERLQEVESLNDVSWKRVTHIREQRDDLEERIGEKRSGIEDIIREIREAGRDPSDDDFDVNPVTVREDLDDLESTVADFEERLDRLFDPCVDLADVPDDATKPVIDLADVKPGDFGMVTFDFLLCDNPGYVWLTGSLVDASENGWTEPELDDPDEDGPPNGGSGDGVVELLDAIEVQIWYDEDGDSLIDGSGQPGVGEEVLFEGTLSEALDALPTDSGIPLDGDPVTAYSEVTTSNGALVPAAGDDENRECFSPSPTPHCIGFRWELPRDAGNEVQTDSVRFDLGFYTEQCRHNDGSGIGNTEQAVNR